jgi:[acyl-carrier-protein] S-malonyltransferase
MALDLKPLLSEAAFAFRGYNVTNLGRTAELLAHPAFGSVFRKRLTEAGESASDSVGRRIDLIGRVEREEETCLATFADAIALIVAAEVAQVECLARFFDIQIADAEVALGYSLGEITAVVCAGILEMTGAISVPVAMADDCAALGENASMGICFSRGDALNLDEINRICLEINQQGRGVMGISAYLSPNTVLVLGQHDTIKRFKQLTKERMPKQVHLRKNDSHWPPMHTPIMWERSIPNRSATMMHTLDNGFGRPTPAIISLVTGKCSYNEYNAREILNRWIDHPQRVWDAVYELLSRGIETVIHVGPHPNLFPATFKRLSDNVQAQLAGNSPSKLGLRFVSGMARRQWLSAILPSRTALLRAPFLQHVILEDWLLEQQVP